MKCTALYGLFSCNLLKFCSNSYRHTGPSPETAMSIAICARLTLASLDRQHDYTILLDVGTVWLADAAACLTLVLSHVLRLNFATISIFLRKVARLPCPAHLTRVCSALSTVATQFDRYAKESILFDHPTHLSWS
jgi:hypothetical protein